jgi:hypothetical protein
MGKVCLAKSQQEKESKDQDSLFDPERLEGDPLKVGVLIKRLPNGKIATNVPRIIVEHSPTGFEIGYGGSGVADFALNILNLFIKPFGNEATSYNGINYSRTAYRQHQSFKETFLSAKSVDKKARSAQGYSIPLETIQQWIEAQK